MSEYTKHYNLKKPSQSENYNVEDANINNTIIDETLYEKQDKIAGKSLSTNDFTDRYKQKLDSLNNYDDTETKEDIADIKLNISNINKELENFDRFTYKGIVTTYNDLANKTAIKGDIYKTNDTNKYYIYDGETWIDYKLEINLESIEKDIETNKNNIEIISDCLSNPVEVSGETIHIEDSSDNLCEIEIEGNSKQKVTEQGNNYFDDSTAKGVVIENSTSLMAPVKIDIEEGTYICQIFFEDGTVVNSVNMAITLYKEDGTAITITNSTARKVTSDYKTAKIAINSTGLTEYAGKTIKGAMLVKGSTAPTIYEEFIPKSPTPNYPSEVECCGDNINLYDGEYHDGKGYNTNTGTLETNTSLYCNKNYINILGGQRKITLSKDGVGKNTRFFFYNSNKQYISTATGEKNVDIPQNAIYLNFQVAKNTVNNDMSNIKIEQGEPTPYSKYGQGNINIRICNKNLAELEFEGGYRGFESGKVIQNSSVNSYIAKVQPNKTYSTRNAHSNLCFFDKDMNYISGNRYQNPYTTNTFSTNNINKACYATIAVNSEKEFQLEEGIITPYEEHKSQTYPIPIQQPMRAIEEYKDTFVNKDGKWYERHCCNRYIFKGTEIVTFFEDFNRIFINTDTNKNILKPIHKGMLYCNYLSNITPDEVLKGVKGIGYSFNNNGFNIAINAFTKAQQYIDFFKDKYDEGNPLYVDYILETPVLIECTTEQIEILDKISRAKTYKPVTNIWTDGIGKLKVKYKRDPQTVLESGV